MEDVVTFDLAKKLKEKGFSCKYPFAMYDEDGDFYPLFTSCDEDESSKCIFGNRMYYDYDDFIKDKDARIAPTISQVLKWLREEKEIDIILQPIFLYNENNREREYGIEIYAPQLNKSTHLDYFKKWEKGSIAGIEYVLDNLI